jgi:uncharacterized protein YndB with AHSA1/START domain
MIELSFNVSIARPPAEVFSILTDFEAYLARWAKGPVAAAKLGPDPTGPGSRFDITAKIGPLRVRSPYEVLEWEPPHRFGGRGVAGPVKFQEEYRLAAGQGTTELTQSIKAWPRGPFRLVQPMIARQLESLLPADLGRLKHLVEDAR